MPEKTPIVPIDDKKRHGLPVYWLEKADRWFYVLIGLAFIYLAGATFVHAWISFFRGAVQNPVTAIVTLINEMLLILILLELLGTIIHYLKVHVIPLEQFLYIGIIACIRRVLAAGSHHSFGGHIEDSVFWHYVWDIGVNGVLIMLLAISLFFFNQKRSTDPDPHKPPLS